MEVVLTSSAARLPELASEQAAAYDVFAPYDCVVPANSQTLIDCGILFHLQPNVCVRVLSRSGLASHYCVFLRFTV